MRREIGIILLYLFELYCRISASLPLADNKTKDESQICDFCIYDAHGNFTSYGYPLNYRNNLNCTYRLLRNDNSSEVCEIELYFHDFDIPIASKRLNSMYFSKLKGSRRENDCREDYLEVNNKKYCGSGWKGYSEKILFPQNKKELVFKLISDSNGTGRGFWIEMKPVIGSCYSTLFKPQASHVCEEYYTEKQFELKSPRFPNNYSMNTDCVYYVRRASDKVCALEMTFHKFDVEFVEGCVYDYLEIEGQKFCGIFEENTRKVFEFQENQKSKSICFQSDSEVTNAGFHIGVRQITDCSKGNPLAVNALLTLSTHSTHTALTTPPSCNVCSNQQFGTLVSYGYPEEYRNSLLCTYTIEPLNDQYCSVEIFFEDFDLQKSDNCNADYLQIEGKRFCSDILKFTSHTIAFDSKDNGVVLVFKTDYSQTNKGFLIKYKQIECANDLIPDKASSFAIPIQSPNRQCDYIYSQMEFTLKSENYSNFYPNNIECNYYVKKNTSKVCYLEFTFVKFDVEASPECQYDYLEVGNTVRLCGSLQTETVRTYIFDSEQKTIKFYSDASTNRPGFYIKVEQLECDGDKIIRKVQYTSTTPSASSVTPIRQNPNQASFESNKDCNQIFEEQEVILTSVGYPNPYSPNIDCLYIIKKINPNICKLDVTFYDFEIQPSDPNGICKYDYVDFNGILVCGDLVKGTMKSYYFTKDIFAIKFHSDKSVTSSDRGFRFSINQNFCEQQTQYSSTEYSYDEYPTYKSQKCDKVFTEPVFEIKSTNYPENYPNNVRCKYTIIKTKDFKVCQLEINFVDINLENGKDCKNDYIDFNGQIMCGSLPRETSRFYSFDSNEFVINFVSDSYNANKGYFLRIRQKECPPVYDPPIRHIYDNKLEQCGGVYRENAFEISSPQYPDNYDNNKKCVYIIKRSNDYVCRIELKFIDFDIDSSVGCTSDYLMIEDKRICGNIKTNQMKILNFYENEKQFIFRSDSFRNRRGFLIKGQQKECNNDYPQETYRQTSQQTLNYAPISVHPSVCELCFTQRMGTIQSYDYPNNYPANLNCKYKIIALTGYCMIQIIFDEFNLEPSHTEKCDTDYLEINYVKYCGRQLEGTSRVMLFSKNPREVNIRFVTNDKINGRGFHASYTQLPCADSMHMGPNPEPQHKYDPYLNSVAISGTYPITVIDRPKLVADSSSTSRVPCDLIIYDRIFEIKSPNYPNYYSGELDCLYSIRKVDSNICKLILRFIYFDVKGKDKNCSGDSLEIFGNKICGRLQNNTIKEFDFNSYKISLRLRTDRELSSNGFLIEGEQQNCQQYPSIPPSVSTYNYNKAGDDVFHAISSSQSQSHNPKSSTPAISYDKQTTKHYPIQDKYQQSNKNVVSTHLSPHQSYITPQLVRSQHSYYPNKSQTFSSNLHSYNEKKEYSNDQISYVNQKQQTSYQQNYNPQTNNQKTSCDQVIQRMYFDIKIPNLSNSQCVYTIEKANDNICQLDLMFHHFDMRDTTCQQQYLFIEGERLCGSIPKDTIRTYKFNEPNIFIYVKLETIGYLQEFNIKGRQVECTPLQIKNKQTSPTYSQSYSSQSFISDSQSMPEIRTYQQHIMPLPFDSIATSQPNSNYQKFADNSNEFISSQYSSAIDTGKQYVSKIIKCDKDYSAVEFTITSPGYPNAYSPNMHCRFTIRQANQYVCAIDMKFNLFDIEDDATCSKDYLEVDAGRICGILPQSHERRYYFLPEEYEKVLTFKSDLSGSGEGFSIYIRQITDCDKPWNPRLPSTPTVCDVCNYNMRGHITSNNYPNYYSDSTKCSYRIQAVSDEYCSVKFYIRDMDIESSLSGDCDKDSLQIGAQKICGKNTKPDLSLNFPNNDPREVILTFHSDGSGNGRGFHLEYVQEQCSKSQPPIDSNSDKFSSDGSSFATTQDRALKRVGSLIPPIYPPNYVSRAHIEEIVQTQVQVLERRANDTLHK